MYTIGQNYVFVMAWGGSPCWTAGRSQIQQLEGMADWRRLLGYNRWREWVTVVNFFREAH